ncbi:MAG: hypothetical protein A4E53_04288 [Pelotomaculum sp. PtaB.Bin104]|nr:MAG: hypothetical protein A4E53_04288 [Pelotomaculum sp. PtaB.Bin104]
MISGGKTGGLLEWAIFVVLIAFTGLVGFWVPNLYFLSTVLMPIPVCLLVLHLDARYSLPGMVAGWLIMLFSGQELISIVMVLHYGLLGMVLGLLVKNRVSSGRSLFAVMSLSAVLALISVLFLYALTKENPFVLSLETRQFLEQMTAINQQNLNGLMSEQQAGFVKELVVILEMLLPGQLIVSAAISAMITYFLARSLIERLMKYKLPQMPAFSEIYLPWYSIWGLIAGLGLTLLGDQANLPLAARAGRNILFVLLNIYLPFGFAVVMYYFRRVKLGLLLKLIFLFLMFAYLPFSITVLLLLGATDPLINFRRLPALKE